MLARIRKAKEENEGGFTLIELLVVVVIIGILAAIAIPTFLNQREKAWEKAVMSDLRNAAVKMEEAFSDSTTGAYPTTVASAGIKSSTGVTFSEPVTEASGNYCLAASHASLGDRVFVLRGDVGVPQEVGTGQPAVIDCAEAP